MTGQRSNQLNYVPPLKKQDFGKNRACSGSCRFRIQRTFRPGCPEGGEFWRNRSQTAQIWRTHTSIVLPQRALRYRSNILDTHSMNHNFICQSAGVNTEAFEDARFKRRSSPGLEKNALKI